MLTAAAPSVVHAPAMPSAASAAGTARKDGFAVALVLVPLVAATFLSKLGVPPLARSGLGLGLPVLFAASLLGVLSGRLALHAGRLQAYLVMLCWIGISQALQATPYSLSSLAFLALLFAPCVLVAAGEATPYGRLPTQEDAWRWTRKLAVFFSACGVAQYAFQFVGGAMLAFPIEHFVPRAFVVDAFNYFVPLTYGSSVYKANGIFFLEPSYFSQFTALGLLLELSLSKRLRWVALHAAALAVTYSGTGLIVLAAGALPVIVARKRWDILLLGAVLAAALALFGEALQLDSFLARINEFSYSGSSGFARFVAWTYMFDQFWWPDPVTMLFGAGAGTFTRFAALSQFVPAEMSFSKMLFEFGLVGATLFFGFLGYLCFSSRAPLAFKVGLYTSVFMNGAYAMPIVAIMAGVLLWPSPAPARAAADEGGGGW